MNSEVIRPEESDETSIDSLSEAAQPAGDIAAEEGIGSNVEAIVAVVDYLGEIGLDLLDL